MFQSLRANNQLYILHKDVKPYVEIGTVSSVTAPKPKYPMSLAPGQIPQMEMVVDLTVNIGGQTTTFQNLPAGQDIADFGQNGNIVISCSRDAMNNEVALMKQKSLGIIESIDMHRSIVTCCDDMLSSLNPEVAEKQKQEREISELKSRMEEMSSNVANLMSISRQLIEQLGGAETSKAKK